MATTQEAKTQSNFSTSNSGTQAQSFTRQPVTQIDLTGLQSLEQDIRNSATDDITRSIDTLGKATVDIITNKALGDLESAQIDNVNEFIDSRKNPEIAKTALENVAGLNQTQNALFAKIGDGATVDDINAVNSALDRELGKFKKAVDQGVISRQEFETRVLATTREAVRRTPGISDALIRHSERVLGLSGVSAFFNKEKQEEDQQAEIKRRNISIEKAADVRRIAFDRENPNHSQINIDIQRYDRQATEFQQLQRFSEAGNILTDQEAKVFNKSGGANTILNGGLIEFSNVIDDSFKENAPFEVGLRKVEEFKTASIARTTNTLREQGLINTTEGQEIIKQYKENLDSVFNAARGFNSGENARIAMQNRADHIRAMQDAELRENFNVSAVNVINGLDRVTAAWVLRDNKNQERSFRLISDLIGFAFNNPTITKGFTEHNLSNRNTDTSEVFVQSFATASPQEISAMSRTLTEGLKNLNAKTPAQAVEFLDKHLNALASPEIKEILKNKDIEQSTISDLTSSVDEYLRQVFNVKTRIIGEANNTLPSALRLRDELTVTGELLPDGRLVYKSSGRGLQDRLNTEIAKRYNLGIAAIGNLAGISTFEASKLMFNRLQGQFDIEKDSFTKTFGAQDTTPTTNSGNPIQLESKQSIVSFAREEAQNRGVPPEIAVALIGAESSFNPNAKGPKLKNGDQAIGLTQLLPGTAKDVGVDINDPADNVRGGIKFLKQQLDTFGDIDLALAAYNAGPATVKDFRDGTNKTGKNKNNIVTGGVPPFRETQNYIAKIKKDAGL